MRLHNSRPTCTRWVLVRQPLWDALAQNALLHLGACPTPRSAQLTQGPHFSLLPVLTEPPNIHIVAATPTSARVTQAPAVSTDATKLELAVTTCRWRLRGRGAAQCRAGAVPQFEGLARRRREAVRERGNCVFHLLSSRLCRRECVRRVYVLQTAHPVTSHPHPDAVPNKLWKELLHPPKDV